MSELKKYPNYSDFSIDEIGYGLAHGSIGVYTYDGKYFWPDLDGVMPDELEKWREKIKSQGFEVPEKYCEQSK
jgi:hypothetical protein